MTLDTSCPSCRRPVPPAARYCGSCGEALRGRGSFERARSASFPVLTAAAVAVAAAVVLAILVAGRPSALTMPQPAATDAADRSVPLFADAPEPRGIVPGTPSWRHPIEPGSAAVGDGASLYLSVDGGVEARDRVNGELRWRTDEVPGNVLRPLRTVLPVVDPAGLLRVLDTDDGSIVWQRPTRRGERPAALSVGPFVVAVGSDGTIAAFDAAGRRFWATSPRPVDWIGTGGSEVGLVFVTSSERLQALHPLTGRVAWEVALDRPGSPVTVVGPTAVLPTGQGKLTGVDLRSGEVVWTRDGTPPLAPAPAGLVAITADGAPGLDLLDPATGQRTGGVELRDDVVGLADDGDRLLVRGAGTVTAMAADGVVAWRLAVPPGVRQVIRAGHDLVLVRHDEAVAVRAP